MENIANSIRPAKGRVENRNDTLNFPDWQWEEFKKNMRNG